MTQESWTCLIPHGGWYYNNYIDKILFIIIVYDYQNKMQMSTDKRPIWLCDYRADEQFNCDAYDALKLPGGVWMPISTLHVDLRCWPNVCYYWVKEQGLCALCFICCGQLWVWHIVCGQTCDGLYRFAFYLVNFWDTSRIPHDQASPSQTHRCPGVSGSRQSDHVIIFHQSQGALWVSPCLLRETILVVLKKCLYCADVPSTKCRKELNGDTLGPNRYVQKGH